MKIIIQKNQGFTFVELVIVIAIISILVTVGFVSYSGYNMTSRDTNRIGQISSIYAGLEVYKTKGDLPLPENNVEIKVGATVIGYQ